MNSFDTIGDRMVEPLRDNRVSAAIFGAASTVGDFSMVWHAVGIVTVLSSRLSWGQAIALSCALGIESLVVNQGVKRIFRRERPTASGDHRFDIRTPRTSSFPSGHASSATFAAIILTSYSGWPLALIWCVIAVIVAMSRVVVRIHHLSDIVGGIVVGALLSAVAVPLISHLLA